MDERLLCVHNASWHDCSDMHSFGGIRNVYIFHYVARGSGWVTARGHSHRVTAGQIFVIYPDEQMSYRPDPADPYCYKWVDFSGTLAKPLLDATALSIHSPVTPVLEEVEQCFDRLIGGFDRFSTCDPSVLELFSRLIKQCPASPDRSEQSHYAVAARDYILANLHKSELRVQDIAGHIGISRSCLFRAFEDKFGVSPMTYIGDQRIKNAKRLLELGVSVKNTALSCGYADGLYFSCVFKKKCGVSPSEYKKSRKNP